MKLAHSKLRNDFLANLIIAGAGRSGTTSLFRYLADHPSVCASSAKEVHFFNKMPPEGLNQESLKRYESYFRHCSPDFLVRVEATAGYLYGGRRTAEAIRSAIPHVKLIFILREPISRAFTIFRKSRTGEPETFQSLSFDDFVAIGLDGEHVESNAKTHGRADKIAGRLMQGCYAQFLSEYFAVFPPEQICVLFFDDFAKDVRSVMLKVAEFLCIDSHFYDSYTFYVENRTRSYRSVLMNRFANRLNVKLEWMLNRYPAVRRSLRQIYNTVNERRNHEDKISELARRRLQKFYEPHNRELYVLLKQKVPHARLPDWIAGARDG